MWGIREQKNVGKSYFNAEKKWGKKQSFSQNRILGISVLETSVLLVKLCNQRILRALLKKHYGIHYEKGYFDMCSYTHIIWLNKDPMVFFLTDRMKKLKETFP